MSIFFLCRNIAASFRMMKRSIGSGLNALSHRHHHRQGLHELKQDCTGRHVPHSLLRSKSNVCDTSAKFMKHRAIAHTVYKG